MVNPQMKEWAEAMTASMPGPLVVDESTHVPTDAELNNISYLSMKYLCQWGMRQCDLAVVNMLSGKIQSIAALRTVYVEHLADYIWDHLMSEPDEPSCEDIAYGINAVITAFYHMDEAIRNDTEAK